MLDVQGRIVWKAPDQRYTAGRWTLRWNGHGAHGRASPGIYMLRVGVGGRHMVRRVVLIR